MPIPVTCPECQVHFHVDDEFAGRPGRCPECAAILQVPDAPAEVEHTEPEPHRPYGTHHFDEPRAPSREVRREDRYDHERELQDDYAEPDRGPRFDPHARAARWEAVSRGLRNLMVAVILVTTSEVVSVAFTVVDGVKPGQGNVLGPREKALIVGNGLFSVISMVLWAAGRIGCGRVPYVPARRVAFPAGVIAGLSAVCGVLAFAGILGGILVAQNNLQAGASLMMLGVCSFLPAGLGFVVAEVMGLVSQVKMATGLKDVAFGRASRLLLVVALLLTFLAFAGICVAAVWIVTETEKVQQQQLQQQRQQAPAPAGGQPGAGQPQPAPPKGKGKGFGAKNKQPNNPPAAPNGQQQPPPPEVDLADHPEFVYGVAAFRLFLFVSYAVVSIACFQLGRRAVRREVARLIGDPHDQHPDGHY